MRRSVSSIQFSGAALSVSRDSRKFFQHIASGMPSKYKAPAVLRGPDGELAAQGTVCFDAMLKDLSNHFCCNKHIPPKEYPWGNPPGDLSWGSLGFR